MLKQKICRTQIRIALLNQEYQRYTLIKQTSMYDSTQQQKNCCEEPVHYMTPILKNICLIICNNYIILLCLYIFGKHKVCKRISHENPAHRQCFSFFLMTLKRQRGPKKILYYIILYYVYQFLMIFIFACTIFLKS